MDPWEIDTLNLTLRLVLSMVLGGLIGIEREQNNHAAGLRTHILVCLGSTLIMLLSIYGFADFVGEENVRIDPARLAAQVISGIGFLGAGCILFNGFSLTGLTTAASLWVVAAIGLSIGAGFYYPAGLATLLVLINLFVLNKIEKKMFQAKRIRQVKLRMIDQPGNLGTISQLMKNRSIEIRKITIEDDTEYYGSEHASQQHIIVLLTVKFIKNKNVVHIIDDLYKLTGVSEVTVE